MNIKTAKRIVVGGVLVFSVCILGRWSHAHAAGWTFMGLPDLRVQTIELHDSHLYAGTFDGVYRLDLNSMSGEWDSLGLYGERIWSLLILSSDTILAAPLPGQPTLRRTTDGGQNWHALDTGFAESYHPVKGLAKLPGQSDTIFANGIDVSRSDDGGQSWQTVREFSAAFGLTIDPNDGRTLYDHGESMIFAPVLQRTVDLGDTWEVLDTWQGGDNSVHDIAFYPGNSDIAWISMEGLIRKTTDGGQNWVTQMTNNRYCFGIEIDPLRPENLYVIGAQSGFPLTLYVSRNGGVAWDTLFESSNANNPYDVKIKSTASGNRLFIGTSSGVYSYFETFGFTCGDVDDDGQPVNISDLVYLVDYMFTGGPVPPNMDAANIDGLNGIDISDLVWLVDYMFTGGPEPVCDR
jgi:photosystem II stability/assembly factor-like uncharacterized protein